MIFQLIMGYISCIGFGYIHNNNLKSTLIGSLAGMLGWGGYLVAYYISDSSVFSTFIGALCLGFICEVFARIFHDASIVFLQPAILPLVPGGGVYYTMRYLLAANYSLAFSKGIETIGCAIAIAIGLLFTSSIVKIAFKLDQGLHQV